MRCFALLITKEFQSENKIAEIMQPYSWESAEYDENHKRITPYPVFEWDEYEICGNGCLKEKDGYIYVDGERINDLLNFEEISCNICIDVNGNAIVKEFWDKSIYPKDEKFDEKLEEIKRNSKGMFVTVLTIYY